ncbi:MAG: hypothetical protein Fur0037_29380 [Planctomycetota bacterium]
MLDSSRETRAKTGRAKGAAARWTGVAALLSLLVAVGIADPGKTAGAARSGEFLRQAQIRSSRVLEVLARLGLLGVEPDPSVFERGGNSEARRGLLRYAVRPATVSRLPSTEFARRGLPGEFSFDLVSVAVDPKDWSDPRVGLDANPLERGRRWERGACVSLFEQGRLVRETMAGIRIHGDRSRTREEKSLRLILTPAYGASARAEDLLPGARGESLVLHDDARQLCFVNPIAYEIAAALGCDVPRTRPVRVMLNGRMLETIYFLTEHLSRGLVAAMLGHRDFLFVNEKPWPRDEPKPEAYASRCPSRDRTAPCTMAGASRGVDVGGVIDWLAAVLFCAPHDCRQGVAYLDLEGDRRWRWIAWDMDWSFQPWPMDLVEGDPKPASFTEDLRRPIGDLRSALFGALMADDPEFRARMLERVRVMLSHELRPERLEAILERYRDIASRFGGGERVFDSLDRIEVFVRERPERLLAELQRVFDLGPLYACSVRVPQGCGVLIDGFPYDRDWSGRFFAGQRLCLEARGGVRGFRAGGRDLGPSARLDVDRDLAIEAVPE